MSDETLAKQTEDLLTPEGWYVRYHVRTFGEQKAGPYTTFSEAAAQMDDIQGFEGVHTLSVFEHRLLRSGRAVNLTYNTHGLPRGDVPR